jgi:hypothetical protein
MGGKTNRLSIGEYSDVVAFKTSFDKMFGASEEHLFL